MKLRLLPGLLGMFCTIPAVLASDAAPANGEYPVVVEGFTDLTYLLDRDADYLNPNWSSGTDATASVVFDGDGLYSLTMTKDGLSESKAPFFTVGTSKAYYAGDSLVRFDHLNGLTFRNESEDHTLKSGGVVSILQKSGTASVEFSRIGGDVAIEGFRAVQGESAVFVRNAQGDANIRFSNIQGNISISNNVETSGIPVGGAALCAWVDKSSYSALVSFSDVAGKITFSGNQGRYLGGAIDASSYLGRAQVHFSNIGGGTSFDGNSSIYGGAVYVQGFTYGAQDDVAFQYYNSTGDVSFTNNSAHVGGAICVAGISQTILFANVKGNIVFDGNSVNAGSGTAYGGAIALVDYRKGGISPMSAERAYGRLEFSNIDGDVSFLNNTAAGGADTRGGAIYMSAKASESPYFVVLSADKGNITFAGNKANDVANAIHMEGQTFTYLQAKEGYSVTFYDPITTGTAEQQYEKYFFYINSSSTSGGTYGGNVVFSGAKINAESLGGDESTLAERLEASRHSIIHGKVTVYGGALIVTDNAVLECAAVSLKEGSKLMVQNGGELVLGALAGTAATLDVEAGATLYSGDTTLAAGGSGLTTATGISNGTLSIADGAILGTFVHDTGAISKDDIVASMKAGFGTQDHVSTQYQYTIGKNVDLGEIAVSQDEILAVGEGAQVSVTTVEAGGQAAVTNGGELSVKTIQDGASVVVSGGTVGILEQSEAVLGSFNDHSGTGTNAHIRLDGASSTAVAVDAGNTDLKAAVNERTVIGKNVSIASKSLDVSCGGNDSSTILVNNGVIASSVTASGNGALIKGAGTFAGGIDMGAGSKLVVGNSPGLQTHNGVVNISGDCVVFAMDGTQAATASVSGWGSGSYSNMVMTQGIFNWNAGTNLCLEVSSNMTGLAVGDSFSLTLMSFTVGNDSLTSVSSVTLGGQVLWDGTTYTALNGQPLTIDMLAECVDTSDKTQLAQSLDNLALSSNFDEVTHQLTVSLNGTYTGLSSIPEPATATLSLAGLAVLMGLRFRRRDRV